MNLFRRPYTAIFIVLVFVSLCLLTIRPHDFADDLIILGLMVYIFGARKSRV